MLGLALITTFIAVYFPSRDVNKEKISQIIKGLFQQ
jgi:hypothetical protein